MRAMLEKLEEVEKRFERVCEDLSDPDITKDHKRLRDLGQERNRLEKIVETFRIWRDVQQQLDDSRELLQSSADPSITELAQEEITSLEPRHAELEESLRLLLLPRDPNDSKNVILEIRSGTGGDEASLFVGDLYRMYRYFAEQNSWRIDIMSSSPGSQGGFKEVIMLLEGEDVYSTLKYESGVHRVQRVPLTETQGRIHTSAVTVAVLPEAEEIDLEISEKDVRIDVYRSSGPGGQSVNTTDSAVRVTHLETGMVVTCQDEKSQHKNRAKAMKILRSRLLDKMQEEQKAKLAAERRSIVKTGDRSEKIRTYNFPQDRLTDHRIGYTQHNLQRVFQGGIYDLITQLRTYYQTEALKAGN